VRPVAAGKKAPPIPGIDVAAGPSAIVFYKVTCPVCQMAAPKLATLEQAYPGHVHAIGQDPDEKLEAFDREYELGIPSLPDLPPYHLSNAFGVGVVPTVFLIGHGGTVQDVVESWDRDGLNRLSRELAELTGSAYRAISEPGDGLPPLRPG
jgi:thiol-disulfide isomerase/thioredoxin